MGTVTLGRLIEDRPGATTIGEHDSIAAAMELMLENDFSQLPVVEGDRAIGLITALGVARCTHLIPEAVGRLRVFHAIDRLPARASMRETIWRGLDIMRGAPALLIEDETGALLGLLTDYDFSAFLRALTEDAQTIHDVESTVKELVENHYAEDPDALHEAIARQVRGTLRTSMGAVRRVVDACAGGGDVTQKAFEDAFERHVVGDVTVEFDGLSFSEHISLLMNGACWSSYEDDLGLPKPVLQGLLDGAREARNRVAHHRGTLSVTDRAGLKLCLRVLEGAPQMDMTVLHEQEPALPGEMVYTSSGEDGADAYLRLASLLQGVREDKATFAFELVSSFIDGGLPVEAHQHRSWWSNDDSSPQADVWLEAGWRVARVNMTARAVTFRRNTARNQQYIAAFGAIFRELSDSGKWPHKLPSPDGESWSAIAGLPERDSTARIVVAFSRGGGFRVEVYIDAGEANRNEAILTALKEHAHELEAEVGEILDWQHLETRRACRLAVHYPEPVTGTASEEDLNALARWVARVAPAMLDAIAARYGAATEL